MAEDSSSYILKLVAKLEDQTKGVFDQIAAHGKVAGEDVQKAMGVAQQAIDRLQKTLVQLKQAQAAGTGDKGGTDVQISAFQTLKDRAVSLQTELGKLPLGIGAIGTAAIGTVGGVLSLKYALDKLSGAIDEGLMKFSQAKLGQEQLATS